MSRHAQRDIPKKRRKTAVEEETGVYKATQQFIEQFHLAMHSEQLLNFVYMMAG